MKENTLAMVCLFVLFAIPVVFAVQFEDQLKHPLCQHCGMDRTKFAHSRMLVTYVDGEEVGTCSLHCAVRELKQTPDRETASVQVADYQSHELINADDALWVLGGNRPGVMTMRAKWAFSTLEGAESFVAKHGGIIVSSEQAIEAGYADLSKDMGRMKKMKHKKMPMK